MSEDDFHIVPPSHIRRQPVFLLGIWNPEKDDRLQNNQLSWFMEFENDDPYYFAIFVDSESLEPFAAHSTELNLDEYIQWLYNTPKFINILEEKQHEFTSNRP